ncbi:MAG TPA: DUF2730 family protein [Azospirillaceae bacterium]|nr:DUF2730 family protein [Azospirillaceae bacterium]
MPADPQTAGALAASGPSVQALLPWLTIASTLVNGVVVPLLIWWRWSLGQLFAARGDLEREAAERAALADRVLVLETVARHLPTAQQLQDLMLRIEGLRGDLKATDESIEGFRDTLARIDRVVDRHEQIIADAARKAG